MESSKSYEERKYNTYKPMSKAFGGDIKVNISQKENPLLKCKRFRFEICKELVEDYDIGGKVSALYLQIKYHIEYPKYLEGRAKTLISKKKDKLKILILHVNKEDSNDYVTQIQLD